MKLQPPRWADNLLEWFCAPHLLEEVQGDLHERFQKNVRVFGEKSARRDYIVSVLGFIRPFALKHQKELSPSLYNKIMISNYFKIAFRNILKYKGYSFINILGLASGMAVAMLIGLWIYDELSFNKNHLNYDKIAQVRIREVDEDGVGISSSMQYPLLTELQNNHQANFKHIMATSWSVDNVLSAGENKVGRKGFFMSASAPEMLTLKMQYGTWDGLKELNSIMLSASTAQTLFGDANPLNQIVKINNETNVKVTGVYEDLPLNSQFNEVKFISPFDLWVAQNKWISEKAINDWDNHFIRIYTQINDKTNFAQASANIKDAVLSNLREAFKEQAERKLQVFLLPMSDWHLYNYKRGQVDPEPLRMVWLISIIGAFVLLLACINFMNLSTARSEKRAKEVGVRKAIGSMRAQLIWQFFSESFLVVLFAFTLSLLFVALSLDWFNQLAAKEMKLPIVNPYFWLISLGFIVLTGLLAGSYPALYLSSFQPVKVLKGTFRVGYFASVPRKVLVVVQFTVSVTLIIGTIIVFKQIQFAKNRPVGYTREGVIMVGMKSKDFFGKHDLLRNELISTGAVIEMAESMGTPTGIWSNNDGFEWKGKTEDKTESLGTLVVTPEYGKTIGWEFLQGRDFKRELASDSAGMVMNEAAVKYMGLKDPIGEDVSWKFQKKERMHYKILGVIKDMVMESPYEPTSPVIFMIRGHGGPNTINIKINPAISTAEALPKIEAVFKKIIPTAPFEYKFVDEEYARKFATEERIGQLANLCAILAILISCLGLFGLASFVAEQRIKEIGIRKILGASVSNLWALLSKDFVLLVVISLFIASPLAYYFMAKWIQKYTYHTEISWWIFALAGIGAMIITILTVSYQAIKAALMNPVRTLKTE
ncbi:permease prefix domain 2-containing transporter [Emticicia sp. C21]|uniref:permease prefix domain 2-containing transporter n=1 Tax=Emticicia sp. C21 TaxID=2302915 RepID=UPI000E34F7A6|nr:permease prefix domain 2-containing transporter [Emticicia sp. C21]RFS16524.1 ABC transporter permease [Emticicia sp. C21]